MGVCAAESKGVHARQRGAAALRQSPVLVDDPKVEFVEWNILAGRLLVKRSRQDATIERQDCL